MKRFIYETEFLKYNANTQTWTLNGETGLNLALGDFGFAKLSFTYPMILNFVNNFNISFPMDIKTAKENKKLKAQILFSLKELPEEMKISDATMRNYYIEHKKYSNSSKYYDIANMRYLAVIIWDEKKENVLFYQKF